MADNFVLRIESLHLADNGETENVSGSLSFNSINKTKARYWNVSFYEQ